MRSVKEARLEVKRLKGLLDRYQAEYDEAQSEEDLSNSLHREFEKRIDSIYSLYRSARNRIKGAQLMFN